MTEGTQQGSGDKTAIRPFRIGFSDAELTGGDPSAGLESPGCIANRCGEKDPWCTKLRHSSKRFPSGREAIE